MAATQGFTSSVYPLEIFGVTVPGYAALYSVLINFLVVVALSPLLDLIARPRRALGRALILSDRVQRPSTAASFLDRFGPAILNVPREGGD